MRFPGVLSTVLFIIVVSFAGSVHAQITPAGTSAQTIQSLEIISANVAKMTAEIETMNKNWYAFFKNLSTDKGGEYFNEWQKRLLFSLEVLNRYEKSLAITQELRLNMLERQTKLRLQLANVTDDLRPESIDRFTAWRGTTDAQAIRDIRRTALQKEQRELSAALAQIAADLAQSAEEVRRMEKRITDLRNRIFAEIDRETTFP